LIASAKQITNIRRARWRRTSFRAAAPIDSTDLARATLSPRTRIDAATADARRCLALPIPDSRPPSPSPALTCPRRRQPRRVPRIRSCFLGRPRCRGGRLFGSGGHLLDVWPSARCGTLPAAMLGGSCVPPASRIATEMAMRISLAAAIVRSSHFLCPAPVRRLAAVKSLVPFVEVVHSIVSSLQSLKKTAAPQRLPATRCSLHSMLFRSRRAFTPPVGCIEAMFRSSRSGPGSAQPCGRLNMRTGCSPVESTARASESGAESLPFRPTPPIEAPASPRPATGADDDVCVIDEADRHGSDLPHLEMRSGVKALRHARRSAAPRRSLIAFITARRACPCPFADPLGRPAATVWSASPRARRLSGTRRSSAPG